MIITIKSTRSELLRVKKRIKLAKKGHELLKKKQDSLIIEFFRLLKEVKAHRDELQEQYTRSLRMMNEARALESDLRIKAATLAVQEAAPVQLQVRNIAGVKVPAITRIERQQEHPLYDSMMLQDVGTAFLKVVELVIELAAKETALRKILMEIRKTKRRAHALEHVFIPQLEAARAHVQSELEERERENFSRLKRRKPQA